jgi:mono/diheme cytochrome c family protein
VRVVALVPASLLLSSCNLYWAPSEPPPGPAVSGGSLLVSRDGGLVVAADPHRDRIFLVDADAREIRAEVALEPDDEPGRIAEDGDGRFHVALRRGGALLSIDRAGEVLARREVCAAPRGVAYQAAGDLLHVACADGDLITFPAAGGDPVRRLRLDADLRDVMVDGDDLLVTRFRAAELLRVTPEGTIASRIGPPTPMRVPFAFEGEPPPDGTETEPVPAFPSVAYRTIALGDGRAVMAHQRASKTPLSIQPGGYGGGGCFDGPVEATATIFDPSAESITLSRRFPGGVLPVDVAVSPDRTEIAVALAGFRTVRIVQISALGETPEDPCGFGDGSDRELFEIEAARGMPTSVAYLSDTSLVVLYDNAIVFAHPDGFENAEIELPGASNLDRGRARFHAPTFSGLACASCHPEGMQDGQVWDFAELGPRRTQNIGGELEARAPYHWGGDMNDLSMLFDEVLVNRMGGDFLSESDRASLTRFLFSLPAPAASWSGDQAAVARGRALFEAPTVGCARCHSGPLYTNNRLEDVGTGGLFKVPSLLGVSTRTPLMHDGCAATLRDRFGPCGGDAHGATANLSEAQIADLVAYLESL